MEEYFKEWNELINELSEKEVELRQLKEDYAEESEEIIGNTDFKGLYGRNNDGIRKMHIKQELHDEYVEIKSLEFSISYIERRISYLRELIRFKRVVMEISKE